MPTHKRPDLNSLLILFLNSSKSELNGRIKSSLCLQREFTKSTHKSGPSTPFTGHSPFGAQVDANAFFELDSRIVCDFAYMVSEQARFIRTNDLYSLAFFEFYPQNATGRGLLFARKCSPNIFIEKLFSALPVAGGPPKRIFGKSSHKQCPVMFGTKRKRRKSSHKARA